MSPPLTFLVVDDNFSNQELVGFMLEAEGHVVRRAMDAGEALRQMEGALPDVILMDVQLPGTSGLDLTRQLKADDRTRTVPVIAVTSYAMKGDLEKALDAGCEGYIAKPIDTATFVDEVMAQVDKARAAPYLDRPSK